MKILLRRIPAALALHDTDRPGAGGGGDPLRRRPIRAGGALIGALGVSGAPGGDKDERCALAALDKLQERLEFAE
jgi:hypothetical protein